MNDKPPDPMTHHPDFSDSQAEMARRFMGKRGGPAFQMILSSDPAWWTRDPDIAFVQITMNVRRAAAQAPYVGPPCVYMWDVAMDITGRWIAGPIRREKPYMDLTYWWTPLSRMTWRRTELDFIHHHHDEGKEPQS